MSARVLHFRELLEKLVSYDRSALHNLRNSELTFLIELFYNISFLSFTLKEQAYLNRRIDLLRSISKIRSARRARDALFSVSSTILPILAKAALKL